MKKIYSLLFTMLLAFVGTGSAWGQIADGNYYLKHKESGRYLCSDVYLSLNDNKNVAAVFSVYEDNGDYVFETQGNYLSIGNNGIPEISNSIDWLTLSGTIDNFTIYGFVSEKYLINDGGYLYSDSNPEYWELENADDNQGPARPTSYDVPIMGNGEDGYYGTFYADQAVTIPDGYTAYVVSDVSAGSVVLNSIVPDFKGKVLAARVPVIIKGSQGNITLNVSNTQGNNASTNLLSGSLEEGSDTEAGFYYYKLAYDSNGSNLGFYWEAGTGGTSISTHPNKAYLKVPTSQGGSNALSFRFEDNVSGIVSVSTKNSDCIYNLQGQRVNGNVAGVYVKNGKKYIVK